MGEGRKRMGEEVRGIRSTNRYLQNSHGDVKYSIGNGVAKDCTHMTHGHELRGRIAGWKRGTGQSGKNWDNWTTVIA